MVIIRDANNLSLINTVRLDDNGLTALHALGKVKNIIRKGGTPLGAESFTMFLQRTVEGINEALTYPNPLIVSHGGVYWAFLKAIEQENNPLSKLPNAIPIYHRPPRTINEPWFISALDKSYDLEQYEGY